MKRGPNKRFTQAARAGIVFPPPRVHRGLRATLMGSGRVTSGAAVYLAAVLEYLTVEIMELGGNASRDMKKKRITPRAILLAIKNDEELSKLLKHVTIPEAGVYPFIRREILPKSGQDAKKSKPSTAPSFAPAPKAAKASKKAPPVSAAASSSSAARAKGKGKRVQDDDGDDDDGDEQGGHGRAEVAGRLAAHKFTPLGSRVLPHGQKLTVVQGSIVYAEVDAIVHPTNSNLSLGGMVGHEIGRLEGNEFTSALQSHTRNQGPLETSGAAVTPAFRLPCSHVIHVNSPTWGEDDSRGKLEKTIHNLLDCAEKGNMRSVALPSIGSGNNGFPKATAANVILESIAGYFAEHRSSTVKEVVFVLFDSESVEVYKHEFARLVTN